MQLLRIGQDVGTAPIPGIVQHNRDGEIASAARSRSHSTTLSELLCAVLVKVTTSWVIAFSAPRTLKRYRPDGVGTKMRVKHQRYPKNWPNTKWEASIKKT